MIRLMTSTDVPDIMRIWIEGNLDAHDFIDGDYWRRNYDYVRRSIADSEVYVCTEKGEIVGFIGLEDDYIAGLFVDREYRGRGIGKRLVDHVKKRRSRLTLHVFMKNKRAVQFYRREGFSAPAQIGNTDVWEQEYHMLWER